MADRKYSRFMRPQWVMTLRNKLNQSNSRLLAARWAILLVLATIVSLVIRALSAVGLDSTALLYVGMPVAIAIVLLQVDKSGEGRFVALARRSLIVLLASSILLYEGFICVIFLMPIYFGLIGVTYLIFRDFRQSRSRRTRLQVSALPLLLLLVSSMEGVIESFAFDRNLNVVSERVVDGSLSAVGARFLNPPLLKKSDHWLLQLFPVPYRIDAHGSGAGDRHRVYYEYRRWLFTNTKRGVIDLQLDQVQPNRISVSIVGDTSYLSTYVGLQRTRIDLVPWPDGRVHVRLSIWFQRRLDPAWYFQPIQQYAMQAMADYLLEEFSQTNGVRHDR